MKAFALTQYDRDLIPENIEQPHISKTDLTTGETKYSYGIEKCGAAIGEEEFVKSSTERKVDEIIEDIEKVSKVVAESDPQSAFAICIFSFQRKAEYLLSTHLPSQTREAVSRLDRALEQALERALRFNALDPIRNYE